MAHTKNFLRTFLLTTMASLCVWLLCSTCSAEDPIPTNPPLQYWKGNIHTHSLWSDGDDFPEMIAEWYRTHDYNFLALTDHNVLSEGDRWMKHSAIVERHGKDALAKYEGRFGGGWVETRGEPGSPEFEIRLKPLDEFRSLVEERGKFIMLQAEEISDSSEGKPVHMNATNLKEVIQPVGGETVRKAIENNFRAVDAQAKKLNREILMHLNHPNFGWAVTAEDLAAVSMERFFEVYNGHPGVNHLGNKDHPSVERLWDIANTIRLAELSTPPMFGVATDDSHYYHGTPGSHTGRGWIMVHSRYLSPEHLIRAVKAGDFYASSGVTLKEVAFDGQTLSLKIEAEEGVSYSTQFIGTLKRYDRTSKPRTGENGTAIRSSNIYSADVGAVLATKSGSQAEYKLTGEELYVRAVVTSTKGHRDPSFTDQAEQAWTQPVGWQLKRP